MGMLLRFRVKSVAVVGDIKRKFHQVFQIRSGLCGGTCSDRALIFLKNSLYLKCWFTLFGAIYSPSVCGYALRKTAYDNEGKYSSSAQNAVKRNFYVDDFVASFDDVDEAICVSQEVTSLVGDGGCKLTKWNSNRNPFSHGSDTLAPMLIFFLKVRFN